MSEHAPSHVVGDRQRCARCGFSLRGADGKLLRLPLGTEVETPRPCRPVTPRTVKR